MFHLVIAEIFVRIITCINLQFWVLYFLRLIFKIFKVICLLCSLMRALSYIRLWFVKTACVDLIHLCLLRLHFFLAELAIIRIGRGALVGWLSFLNDCCLRMILCWPRLLFGFWFNCFLELIQLFIGNFIVNRIRLSCLRITFILSHFNIGFSALNLNVTSSVLQLINARF